MSEQQEKTKSGFMAALDAWTEANVIAPLVYTNSEEEETFEQAQDAFDRVKLAIREKVLESYRNGCKAGAGHVRREQRQAPGQPVSKQRSFVPAQVH